MKLHREHGGVARFRLGPKIAHLISDPAAAQEVLHQRYKQYVKGRPYARARFAFGRGLITIDGEEWRRHRKLMQPVFHRSHFPAFASVMTGAIASMLDRWEGARGPINVATELRNLALRIAARSLFTADIDRDADRLQDAFNEVQLWFTRGSRSGYLIPPTFPTPANLRLKRTLGELHALVDRLIAARRAARERPGDLLTLLMEARDEEDGTTLGDAELRDEVMTLLFAAHESTGSTIAWALYLLSKHPEHERRVRAEVARALGDRTPSFETLTELPLTRRVCEETMRLYPAAPIIPREALVDDELGGFHIPKGSVVFVSPYVMHRDEETWPNPEAFDPDRFLPENVEKRHRFSYLPFVLGPRQCIGNHFAMTEMLLAVPMILRRFEMALVPGMRISTVHMRFDEGMWMTARPVPVARQNPSRLAAAGS